MPNEKKPTGDNGDGNKINLSKFKKAFKQRWILILLLKVLDIDLDDDSKDDDSKDDDAKVK